MESSFLLIGVWWHNVETYRKKKETLKGLLLKRTIQKECFHLPSAFYWHTFKICNGLLLWFISFDTNKQRQLDIDPRLGPDHLIHIRNEKKNHLTKPINNIPVRWWKAIRNGFCYFKFISYTFQLYQQNIKLKPLIKE